MYFRIILAWLSLSLCISVALGDPVRFVGKDPLNPITFGLEIEYNLKRDEKPRKLLKYYTLADIASSDWDMVRLRDFQSDTIDFDTQNKYSRLFDRVGEKVRISPIRWRALSDSEKFSFFKHYLYHSSGIELGKMTKIDEANIDLNADELALYHALPERLHREHTGNLEIHASNSNELVFQTLDEVRHFLTLVKDQLGQGDVQGHVVFKQVPLSGSAGYSIYEGDRAIFRRLIEEYQEYEQDPSFVPAINFLTGMDAGPGALLPMSQLHKHQIELIEGFTHIFDHVKPSDHAKPDGHVKPGDYREAARKLNINGSWSFARCERDIAPNLRTSGYPQGLIGFEIRMEDNPFQASCPYIGSSDRLVKALDRVSALLERDGSLKTFNILQNVELSDLNSSFDSLNKMVRQMGHSSLLSGERLAQYDAIVQNLNRPDYSGMIQYTLSAHYDTLSPFFFVLRNWQDYPLLLASKRTDLTQVRAQLVDEQVLFLVQFSDAIEAFSKTPSYGNEGRSHLNQIIDELRVAVARWANKTQIFDIFLEFEEENGILH